MQTYLANSHSGNWRTVTNSVRNCAVSIVLLLFTGACASTGSNPVAPQVAATGESAGKNIYQTTIPVFEQLLDAELELLDKVEEDSSNVDAYLRLAVLYRQMEKFDQAERAVNRAMQLSNSALYVKNELGILQRSQGQFDQARKTYESILQLDPGYANAHFNLGILYDLYLRQPGQAHLHYEAYLKTAPHADGRVEKWLVDLQRRYGLDANTSMVQVSE